MYTAEWKSSFQACYHPGTNAMFFSKEDIKKEDIESQRTRLHETIHALTGATSMFRIYLSKMGLLEGGTENIVEKLYGDKHSTYDGKIMFNFSRNCSYLEQVCLVKQMEYVMNSEFNQSILKGDDKFFKDFSKRYGKDLFRFIRHKSNRLLHPTLIKDDMEYFKKIATVSEVMEYFKRLQSFELVRGKIDEDISFKEYYQSKLQLAKEILVSKGYGEAYLQQILEKC